MREEMGKVTVRSGALAVVDTGTLGDVGEALANLAVTARGVREAVFPIYGERLGKGRFGDCWSSVYVELDPAQPASSEKLGEVPVDNARLLFADPDALQAWKHEEPVDGRADFVFWGLDAPRLAQIVGADEIADEGFGWPELPLEDARAKGMRTERIKNARGFRLATDFRPHSHHYQVLAQQRATPTQSGTIAVEGAHVTSFHTTWGDGVFAVYADRDASGKLVRFRVQLASEESLANMEAVNPEPEQGPESDAPAPSEPSERSEPTPPSEPPAPDRPPNVPADARWSARDEEWALVPLDDRGLEHGRAKYWRADGTLVNECGYEHGVPHGPFRRFHDNGEVSREGVFDDGAIAGSDVTRRSAAPTREAFTPPFLLQALLRGTAGKAEDVWRIEQDFEDGAPVRIRFFTRDGTLIAEKKRG